MMMFCETLKQVQGDRNMLLHPANIFCQKAIHYGM
jgi:hypothetical protein